MPDKLKLFLETLPYDEAEAIAIWFDSNPDAAWECITLLASTHKLKGWLPGDTKERRT